MRTGTHRTIVAARVEAMDSLTASWEQAPAWLMLPLIAVIGWILREITFPLREKDIRGQVALITGGGSGIGRLMALGLAKKGCVVIVWDKNLEAAKKVVAEIDALNLKLKAKGAAYEIDLTEPSRIFQVAQEVLEEFGPVDILINNAGVVSGRKLVDADIARIELVIKTNLIAPLMVTKAFLPAMIENKRGHIISISSAAGRVGSAHLVDYCASKFGLIGFDEALRIELRYSAPELRTTCVCPSIISTGMFKGVEQTSTVPWLNSAVRAIAPELEPQYVADKVITAIVRNQTVLVLPRFGYVTHILRAFIPTAALDSIFGAMGAAHSFDKFRVEETGRT